MTKTKTVISFVNVAAGATSVLPHGLNVNNIAVTPDQLETNGGGFTLSADATNITATNNLLVPASVDVLATSWPDQDRQFGTRFTDPYSVPIKSPILWQSPPSTYPQEVLSPQPFTEEGGSGGVIGPLVGIVNDAFYNSITDVCEIVHTTTGAPATGSITFPAKAFLSNHDLFTIADGVHVATTFEFEVVAAGYVPTPGRVQIDISAGGVVTGDDIKTIAIPLITAVATLDVTASNGGVAVANLVNDHGGAAGNILITVSTPFIATTGMGSGTNVSAAGLGTGLLYRGENGAGATVDIARVAGQFTNVGAGTEATKIVFQARVNGAALVEAMSLSPYYFTYTRGAPSIAAGTEDQSVLWNLANSKRWATGALALQREFVIAAPTYAFVGASTITDAALLYLSHTPIAGANCTITNSYAFLIDNNASAAAQTLGIGLRNSTAAIGATPVQSPPGIHFVGHVWNTTGAGSDAEVVGYMQYVPVSGLVPYGRLTVDQNNIVTTPTPAFVVQNTTAATNSVPVQYGPMVVSSGTMWDGAASVTLQGGMMLVPATAATQALLKFYTKVGAGAWTEQGSFTSYGALLVNQGAGDIYCDRFMGRTTASLRICGNLAAADAGNDIKLYSFNTRTNGNLFIVANGTAGLTTLAQDFNGVLTMTDIRAAGLTTAVTPGLTLTNPVAATGAVPVQYGPMIVSMGSAWDLTAAAPVVVQVGVFAKSVSGATAAVRGDVSFRTKIGATPWSEVAYIDANGSFYSSLFLYCGYAGHATVFAAGMLQQNNSLLLLRSNLAFGTADDAFRFWAYNGTRTAGNLLAIGDGAAYAQKFAIDWMGSVHMQAGQVSHRRPINDVNCAIAATDFAVFYSAISAPHVAQLPTAASVGDGFTVVIGDASGSCAAGKEINITPNGAETINGVAALYALNASHNKLTLMSDGVSNWEAY